MTSSGRIRRVAALLAVFSLLLFLSCGKTIAPEKPPELEIRVEANEYEFNPATFNVPPETKIRLVFENTGEKDHSLEFESDVSKVRLFAKPGKRASALLTTPGLGAYPYWCDIGSHRFFGMEGTMVVRAENKEQ